MIPVLRFVTDIPRDRWHIYCVMWFEPGAVIAVQVETVIARARREMDACDPQASLDILDSELLIAFTVNRHGCISKAEVL